MENSLEEENSVAGQNAEHESASCLISKRVVSRSRVRVLRLFGTCQTTAGVLCPDLGSPEQEKTPKTKQSTNKQINKISGNEGEKKETDKKEDTDIL